MKNFKKNLLSCLGNSFISKIAYMTDNPAWCWQNYDSCYPILCKMQNGCQW